MTWSHCYYYYSLLHLEEEEQHDCCLSLSLVERKVVVVSILLESVPSMFWVRDVPPLHYQKKSDENTNYSHPPPPPMRDVGEVSHHCPMSSMSYYDDYDDVHYQMVWWRMVKRRRLLPL